MFLKPKWIQISFVKICKTYRQLRTGVASNLYFPVKTTSFFTFVKCCIFKNVFIKFSNQILTKLNVNEQEYEELPIFLE